MFNIQKTTFISKCIANARDVFSAMFSIWSSIHLFDYILIIRGLCSNAVSNSLNEIEFCKCSSTHWSNNSILCSYISAVVRVNQSQRHVFDRQSYAFFHFSFSLLYHIIYNFHFIFLSLIIIITYFDVTAPISLIASLLSSNTTIIYI